MQILPKALTDTIEELGKLPGVGPRTAERYAYYLLRADPHIATRLAASISNLHGGVDYCKKTFALVEKGQELSPLYTDPARNKKLVAVVEEPPHLRVAVGQRLRNHPRVAQQRREPAVA